MNPDHNNPAVLRVLSPEWITDSNGVGHWNVQHRWSEAEAISISGKSFILLASNIGNSPDNTIDDLIKMMKKYRLDPYWGTLYGASAGDPSGYWTLDPCEGVRNPHAGLPGEETWIDGPRMFSVDGVYSFHGNFYRYSYGFSIYTNHEETIERLKAAITENMKMIEDHPEVRALEPKPRSVLNARCTDGKGFPTNHPATGWIVSPGGKRIGAMCGECAQIVIDEYREKLEEIWTFEPADSTTWQLPSQSAPQTPKILTKATKSSTPNLSSLLDLFPGK